MAVTTIHGERAEVLFRTGSRVTVRVIETGRIEQYHPANLFRHGKRLPR
ncbi:hypothetical protein UFOVP1028_2 [uncultured Caudovirales phage]|uniref:Uncharacterized protein n=1 Tax=uncultured Caudovirales phage TaxID=2100421 RepID=A0A6J5Q8R7_9CAUD|nr:hypothetical protein UFOVP960_13 [uncultured Caudovirales phage]CAB4178767.1 hypothetical protein UFOVP1028_2 [uncultured Caudovirales phage]CAB4189432.1 hypothetical protein UFOVP1187_17 [uncultured Caudovirales phage]CAB4192415.1 hypothetical protein UFOVP1235_34 [uncultured Caudovirales phage]CAB4215820.1 hypothetical protein UFOVP1488_17 [uncultured Caudovirales phage]